MSDTITVREATEQDLTALTTLYRDLHPDDPVLAADQARHIWRQIAAQPGRTILIAVKDHAAAGTADCLIVPNLTRAGRPYMVIENVVVHNAARRHGVGTLLCRTAFARARAAGCYKVQLLSRADRAEAHAFYESCGLRATAQGYRAYLDPARHGPGT